MGRGQSAAVASQAAASSASPGRRQRQPSRSGARLRSGRHDGDTSAAAPLGVGDGDTSAAAPLGVGDGVAVVSAAHEDAPGAVAHSHSRHTSGDVAPRKGENVPMGQFVHAIPSAAKAGE